MIKYRTGSCGSSSIVAVEVERETDKCVWIRGSRSEKISSYQRYHDSWAEAHAYLLGRHERQLESARRQLENAEKSLTEIQALRAPE